MKRNHNIVVDRHKVRLHVNTASVLIYEALLLLDLQKVCYDVLQLSRAVELVMHHQLQTLQCV